MPDPRLRVLYVEDDALNRVLLRAALARADNERLSAAEIVEATTLAEARKALTVGVYDLLLLDRRLPDGDGFTLAAELGAGNQGRPLVVALTADAVPATRAAAFDAGCDAILTKPYAPADLVALLSRHLENRQTA